MQRSCSTGWPRSPPRPSAPACAWRTSETRAASLEAALEREQGLRKRAEGALDQAKAASAEVSSQLEAERAARKQAEVELARVDEKAATLEQQVNLTWSQLKVSEEEQQQGSQPRRWWRGEG
jgi:FKBP-type peptidyl-prolyl cis-trans isomerase